MDENIQFIECNKCNGTGRDKIGVSCKNCHGYGIGVFFERVFLYWGARLSLVGITLRHLKNKVNLFINFFAYLLSFSGLLSLVFWFWKNIEIKSFEILSIVDYLYIKNIFFLLFWVGVLSVLFIIYRFSEIEDRKQKIVYKKLLTKNLGDLPDNWERLKKHKQQTEISASLSEDLFSVVESSFQLASKNNQSRVSILHFFYKLLKQQKVQYFFVRLDVDGRELIRKLENNLFENSTNINKLVLSSELKEVLIRAYENAYNEKKNEVDVMDVILPCIEKNNLLREILYDLEIDENKIKNVLQWFKINKKLADNYKLYKKLAMYKPGTTMDRSYTAVATPVLNNFSHDLTISAKWGRLSICVDRDKEFNEIFEAVTGGKTGVILTGPNGVGKKSIINGIARLMVEESVPKQFQDKRLVELDLSRLLGGASAAEAEERLLTIIDEVSRAGNIILFIENIQSMIGITSGGEESMELSEVLVNALQRNYIYCLATASEENYAKYIEGKPLSSVMSRVKIDEPETNNAIQICESKIGSFENKYGVYFSYESIEAAVKLSGKYMHDKFLPEKAIDILNATAVKVAKDCQGEKKKRFCTKDDVAYVINKETGIPVSSITEDEGKKLLNLENEIHKRMIGQVEAVKMVADSLRRARTELRESKRPIASFLFLGPTGVGKTELAKSVAEVYFNSEDTMIRLDMSEYQGADSVNKMIGDPSGTGLGYLTEAVRKKPFSLILLDEIEKAHSDILNLFLQVMDDGRLTDGRGRTIDFSNSIIIATSNIGSLYIQAEVKSGTSVELIKEELINNHINKIMRPELVNRFSGVIVFTPLTQDHIEEIASLMLNKTKVMLEQKGINLKISDSGLKIIARDGYDPEFGARPLRRLLEEKIDNVIVNNILGGELKRRDTVFINEIGDVLIEKASQL